MSIQKTFQRADLEKKKIWKWLMVNDHKRSNGVDTRDGDPERGIRKFLSLDIRCPKKTKTEGKG